MEKKQAKGGVVLIEEEEKPGIIYYFPYMLGSISCRFTLAE